jgi:hypothetical protein
MADVSIFEDEKQDIFESIFEVIPQPQPPTDPITLDTTPITVDGVGPVYLV